MRQNSKILSSLFCAAVLSIGVATPVLASGESTYGQAAYGGGVIEPREGNVMIDKSVMNPATGTFVDHLGADDPKYRPGQIITFRLKVNNPGNDTLEKISVTDIFPVVNEQVVIDYMSGPGEYSKEKNELTFDVLNLEAGQSKEFEVKGKIVHASALPEDSVTCLDPGNIARAQVGETVDEDQSRFCIVKDIVETMKKPEIPEAGPAEWVALFSGLTAMAGVGTYLRRKSNGAGL